MKAPRTGQTGTNENVKTVRVQTDTHAALLRRKRALSLELDREVTMDELLTMLINQYNAAN